jgi:oxygen-independent coproporphyrinogen-3 oxidase
VLAAARPASRRLGLYVHVPFCQVRCPYCAFATAPMDTAAMRRFVAALLAELDLLGTLPWAGALTLASVFFGGGTPSLLAPEDLAAALERVRARFALDPGAEITVESNPESVTRERLAAYRAAGVNRVSLGVQALDDAVLARLGRLHAARGARAAFVAAREAGVPQVSVDLMYGVPGLDLAGWRRGVEAVLDWAPDHLSAYGLSLDAGSRWGSTGVADLPAEDTVVAQYWALAEAARARGFEPYEISNYARPGCRSTHNVRYWRRGEYLAAGPAACGFVGDVRWSNARAVPRWAAAVEAGRLPVESHEVLDARQALVERLVLGLRTVDGVPAAWLAQRAEGDVALARRLTAWRAEGLLVDDGPRVRLSERGFLLSDALFVALT